MAQKSERRNEKLRRLQLLAQYRAWYEAFAREHGAAVARSRLLRLRCEESNWNWLPL